VRGKGHGALAYPNGAVTFNLDLFSPTSLHRVKREQMRSRSDPAFKFVEMDDLKAIIAARIVVGTMCGAKSCPQS
jgi:hypothetical protein